jgi:hypothetical protein
MSRQHMQEEETEHADCLREMRTSELTPVFGGMGNGR